MNLIKKFFAGRLLYHLRKKLEKSIVKNYIKKHNLNNIDEQKKVISQYNLMQENKRAFGRKHKQLIEEKVCFMIKNEIIKVIA